MLQLASAKRPHEAMCSGAYADYAVTKGLIKPALRDVIKAVRQLPS